MIDTLFIITNNGGKIFWRHVNGYKVVAAFSSEQAAKDHIEMCAVEMAARANSEGMISPQPCVKARTRASMVGLIYTLDGDFQHYRAVGQNFDAAA